MCRKNGLEQKRRCGWLNAASDAGRAPVWTRNGVALDTCPTSFITAESEALLEEFLVMHRLGGVRVAELSARQVDAFVVLEKTLREMNNGRD